MSLPTISLLDNNFTMVQVGEATVWFSYTTPVGFRVTGHNHVVRINAWGVTTGKHLNRIDGGSAKTKEGRAVLDGRVDEATFLALWKEQTGTAGPGA